MPNSGLDRSPHEDPVLSVAGVPGVVSKLNMLKLKMLRQSASTH